jgi:N-methylhydantoinase B/oxoprolinase/acetone carboxylase alpha subunit
MLCAQLGQQRGLVLGARLLTPPSHLGSLAHIVPRAIAVYGPEYLKPGDGILIDALFLGNVHLNDITLIGPVFHGGEIFGYLAHIAHHVDVGGGAPGSIGVSNEIYQEGMVIPPTGDYFTFYETIAGGYGATRRNDGMDAVQAHFQKTENAPMEETEANYLVRILRCSGRRPPVKWHAWWCTPPPWPRTP